MLKEFRDFINRGNVMDLAVAVIIGAAFTAIVNSLVNDLIMPLIGIIVGGLDFSSLSFSVGDAVFTYGNFIQAVINFLLVAFVLFLIVRSINNLHQNLEKEEEEIPEEEPQPSAEEILLTEIRDLLKKKKSKK